MPGNRLRGDPNGVAPVWEDAETLSKADDWTEFTLNCDSRGKSLWLEVAGGKVQADWAEIVFANGTRRSWTSRRRLTVPAAVRAPVPPPAAASPRYCSE